MARKQTHWDGNDKEEHASLAYKLESDTNF